MITAYMGVPRASRAILSARGVEWLGDPSRGVELLGDPAPDSFVVDALSRMTPRGALRAPTSREEPETRPIPVKLGRFR
jgi:hypothetical protein